MSNKQNDGIYTRAPKPTDVKAYVGDVVNMEFTTKESIPVAYRFVGMEVKERISNVTTKYRLEGGVADINYIEVINDSTGLESLTESGNTGWRFVGATAANYGNIGDGATDLSYSSGASSVLGATGDYSVAGGYENIVSGTGAIGFGYNNRVAGNYAVVLGYYNRATGNGSHVSGLSFDATNYSEAVGVNTLIHQQVETGKGIKQAIGINSAIIGGKNNSTSALAINTVVLGGEDIVAVQPDVTYVSGTKYEAYTTGAIAALLVSELGTILFDTTQNKLVQCTDATPSALVWTIIPNGVQTTGTVTSVAATNAGGEITIGGSPITTNGTLTFTVHVANMLSTLGVAAGAEVNVQSDWDAVAGDSLILNKPNIFEPAFGDVYINAAIASLVIGAGDVNTWLQMLPNWVFTSSFAENLTQTTDGFTIIDDGIYKVMLPLSVQYSVNLATINLGIYIDNGATDLLSVNVQTEIYMPVGADSTPIMLGGYINVNTGDLVKLHAKCDLAGTFTIQYGNFSLQKVGVDLP